MVGHPVGGEFEHRLVAGAALERQRASIDVAARMAGDDRQPQAWSIKKGAVWWFRRRDREGVVDTVLQAVQAPDCL